MNAKSLSPSPLPQREQPLQLQLRNKSWDAAVIKRERERASLGALWARGGESRSFELLLINYLIQGSSMEGFTAREAVGFSRVYSFGREGGIWESQFRTVHTDKKGDSVTPCSCFLHLPC